MTFAPAASAAGAGGMDHRAVGERVRVGHAELDHVGAGVDAGLADTDRLLERREAAHHVGHQRGALAVAAKAAARRCTPVASPCSRRLREHLGEVLVAAAGEAHEVELAVRLRQHPGERVGGLQRRDDPLQAGDLAKGRERLRVGDRDVAGAAAVAQVRRAAGPAPG